MLPCGQKQTAPSWLLCQYRFGLAPHIPDEWRSCAPSVVFHPFRSVGSSPPISTIPSRCDSADNALPWRHVARLQSTHRSCVASHATAAARDRKGLSPAAIFDRGIRPERPHHPILSLMTACLKDAVFLLPIITIASVFSTSYRVQMAAELTCKQIVAVESVACCGWFI